MILKTIELGFFGSNCFIVGSEKTKEGMIIDPGANAREILEEVRETGLRITLIVATHTHIDHVGALKKVKEETGARYAVHEAEAEGMGGMMGAMQGLAGVFGKLTGGSLQPPPKPDILLREGDVIEVGEIRFKVLHTPGHSPGGISLYGEGVVFSGDALFNFGIGRTDFPGQGVGYDMLMNSIHTKLMTLPDETIVLPGHGPQTTIGVERKWNPFLSG